MDGENEGTQREKDVNSLVERIKSGIAAHGVYIIDETGLELICGLYQSRSDEEKRMHLENFAVTYGYSVYVTTNSTVAIFRKPN